MYFATVFKDFGFEMKVMKVKSNSEASMTVGNSEANELNSFTYLGANVTKDGSGTADIRKRIAMTSASFRKLDDNI